MTVIEQVTAKTATTTTSSQQVSSHKILGVVIDSQMNYESHIDKVWCYKTHPSVWEYDMGQLQYRKILCKKR